MERDRRDRMPDAAEIAAINATHLIDVALEPADLLFVFGTREDAELRAKEACRLWRCGGGEGYSVESKSSCCVRRISASVRSA